jgi:hypothetical protein
MERAAEFVAIFQQSLDRAIEYGYLIISGDYGVKWSADEARWVWDPGQVDAPGCCALGAYMLETQPPLHPSPCDCGRPHLPDDIWEAARDALGVPRTWLGDFLNGFDGESFSGDCPDAYGAGMKLREMYCPINADYLHLDSSVQLLPSDVEAQMLLE